MSTIPITIFTSFIYDIHQPTRVHSTLTSSDKLREVINAPGYIPAPHDEEMVRVGRDKASFSEFGAKGK
jgi:hypothetical protein